MSSLESAVICIDNSEYSRNGDFMPSRLRAQQETIYDLIQSKLRGNQKNMIALLTMAGQRPEVVVTLSRDLVNIQRKLFNLKPCGSVHLLSSIRIAQLVVKNRQDKSINTNRIVVFLCSPFDVEGLTNGDDQTNTDSPDEQLYKIGTKIRKENINLDIIIFGSEEENEPTLNQLRPLMQVMDENLSHIMTVNSGYDLSFVVANELNFELVDYHEQLATAGNNEDHDLAMAIQLSLQGLNKTTRPNTIDTEATKTIQPDITLHESNNIETTIGAVPGPSSNVDDRAKSEKGGQLQMNKLNVGLHNQKKVVEVKKLDLLTIMKIPLIKAQAIDKQTVKRNYKTASQQFKNLLFLCTPKELLAKNSNIPSEEIKTSKFEKSKFPNDLDTHLVRSRILEHELRLGKIKSANQYLQSKLFNQFDDQKSVSSIQSLKGKNRCLGNKDDYAKKESTKIQKEQIVKTVDDISNKNGNKNTDRMRILENDFRLNKFRSKLSTKFNEEEKSGKSILTLKAEKCQLLKKLDDGKTAKVSKGETLKPNDISCKNNCNNVSMLVDRSESSNLNLRQRSLTAAEMITAYRRPKYTSLIFKNPYHGNVLDPAPYLASTGKKSNPPDLVKQTKHQPVSKQTGDRCKPPKQVADNSNIKKCNSNSIKSKFTTNKKKDHGALNSTLKKSSFNKSEKSSSNKSKKNAKPPKPQQRNFINTTATAANNNNNKVDNNNTVKSNSNKKKNETKNANKTLNNKTTTTNNNKPPENKSNPDKTARISRNPNTTTNPNPNNTNTNSNKTATSTQDQGNQQQQKSIKANVKTTNILNDSAKTNSAKKTKSAGTDNKQKTVKNKNKGLNKSNQLS